METQASLELTLVEKTWKDSNETVDRWTHCIVGPKLNMLEGNVTGPGSGAKIVKVKGLPQDPFDFTIQLGDRTFKVREVTGK